MDRCKYCGKELRLTHEINNICYECSNSAIQSTDGVPVILSKATKYDFVKGYKSPIVSMPKDIKDIVAQHFEMLEGRKPTKNDMLEVDVYYAVDLKNYYNKE